MFINSMKLFVLTGFCQILLTMTNGNTSFSTQYSEHNQNERILEKEVAIEENSTNFRNYTKEFGHDRIKSTSNELRKNKTNNNLDTINYTNKTRGLSDDTQNMMNGIINNDNLYSNLPETLPPETYIKKPNESIPPERSYLKLYKSDLVSSKSNKIKNSSIVSSTKLWIRQALNEPRYLVDYMNGFSFHSLNLVKPKPLHVEHKPDYSSILSKANSDEMSTSGKEITNSGTPIDIECNFKQNMHLDICGKCVNNTGSAKSNVNDCGVCEGSEGCNSCSSMPNLMLDQCGQCLKLEDKNWNNCTRTFGISPSVIDLISIEEYGTVYLKGFGLSETSLPNLICFIHNIDGNSFLNVISVLPRSDNLQIKFEANNLESEYEVHCNTSNEEAILEIYNLKIVNSNSLSLLMMSPSSVDLGKEVEFFVIVRGVSTLSEIICFIKTEDNILITALPSDKIQGNSLITNITCPLYKPTCAGDFIFGVAYTYDAIAKLGNSNSKKLVVKTNAPELKKRYFSSDLRRIIFEFTDIIDGPSNCTYIFIPDTVKLLGNLPVCLFSGNSLRLTLGQPAFVRSVDEIIFFPGRIRSACGSLKNAPAFSGRVVIDPQVETKARLNKPSYKLIGPHIVCADEMNYNPQYLLSLMNRKIPNYKVLSSNSTTQFVAISEGDEQIRFKWTLRYYFDLDGSDLEGGLRQRRNLLVWLSVRELEKILKIVTKHEVNIDNSLLVPNVKYVLSVIGQNQLGEFGDNVSTTFEFIASNKSLIKDPQELVLIGPSKLNIWIDNNLEAKLMSTCSKTLLNNVSRFNWTIDNVDLSTKRGSKLFLPARTLKSNERYKVECAFATNSEILYKTSFNFQTIRPPFKITIGTSELIFGTGQTLQLWAAVDSTFVSQSSFEFIWSCEYNGRNDCYLPDKHTTRLQDRFSSEFKKRVLIMKPGSLMVGIYTFKVAAILKEENITEVSSSTKVIVVPGEPPLVSIEKYSIFSVNPNEDLNIVARISRLSPGCRLNWEFLRVIGSSFINLNSVVDNTSFHVPYDSNIKSMQFPLIIPRRLPKCEEKTCNILQENTTYTLALFASCSAKRFSYATTTFQTASLPKLNALEVSPREGTGLITEFQFNTEPAYMSEEYQPLVYSFGFKVPGEETVYVYTSSNWYSYRTVLPSLSTMLETFTTIETFLKVCNAQRLCITKQGPSVYTSNPKNITFEELNALKFKFSMLMRNEEYNEAFTTAFIYFITLKASRDFSVYKNLSQFVEFEILKSIDVVQTDMKHYSHTSTRSAINLIDSITATAQYLLHSELLLKNLVSLKKNVLQALKDSKRSPIEVTNLFGENGYRKKSLSKKHGASETLFWKARIRREINFSPQSREEVLTLDTVKTMLEASEVAILNFTQEESAVSEVRELLQNVDYFVSSLCDQTFNDGKLIYIGTKVAELSVKRIRLDVSCTEEMPLPACMSDCLSSKAYIKLGEKLSKNLPDNDNICYASLIYPSDYLSKVYNPNILGNNSRLSNVYSVKLMTHSDYEAKTEEEIYNVEMKIPIRNFTSENGLTLKCFVWIMERREWFPDLCQSHIVVNGGRFIRCECPVNHYISVFLVNETTDLEETTQFDSLLEGEQNLNHVTAYSESMHQLTTRPDWELISIPYHRVTFRIEEDYKSIVGENSNEFIESVTNQLIQKFSVPKEMFRNVSVYPGTIMVTMQLVNSTSVSVGDILPTLVRALNFGELKLTDINGKLLNVPPQLLQISEKLTGGDDDSYTALLITVIGFMICIAFLISFSIFAVVLKKNRDKMTDKIEETVDDSDFPKYRELYFEQSIDGSEASLNRYSRPVHIQFQDGEDSGISIIPDLARNQGNENGGSSSSNVHGNNPTRHFLPGSTVDNI